MQEDVKSLLLAAKKLTNSIFIPRKFAAAFICGGFFVPKKWALAGLAGIFAPLSGF
ncbi:MAG: hypothetical protein IT236_17990 [Bacteroidia bacterium]|nr:hypothetical protein [Bacteroidia bacterium]